MRSTNIVFLHGAGLGSYIWDEMKPFITSEALFVDLPNRGATKNSNKKLNFKDYLNHVIEQINCHNTNEFLLVVHSISGIIGLKLIEHFGKRINGFIAISAVIPTQNSSFISCLPFPQKLIMPIILTLFGTKPPNKTIRQELCNDLSESQSTKVVENFTPESKSLFTTKINYKDISIKTLYIKLLNDTSFSTEMQNKMSQNLKSENSIELQSDHLPMMSHPKKLAEILNNFMKSI